MLRGPGGALRIVPTSSVLPHEVADPGRLERIERRLREDGVLRDPVIAGAVPDLDGYVLLDGTNRKGALMRLGLPWILIQEVDYADTHAVELRTWCHAARIQIAAILAGSRSISDVVARPIPPLATVDMLAEPATLAVLLDGKARVALVRRGDAVPRARQLRDLVDLYEAHMERVDCAPDEVEERSGVLHGTDATLVAFPRITRAQVAAMAMDGTPIPAGITRHVLTGGRALRVNVPLDTLDGSGDLAAAQAALDAYLETLHPRVYREPTVLWDS